VISQGDRRPLLHHCPGIAIRLTPSKPRKRSPGGDDCSHNRPVRPSEVETTSRMKRTSATFDERSWSPSAAPMSMGPKADSADLQPVASEKSPIRPDHSHWLAGGYSQKLGGKFAQGFCDATVKGYVNRVVIVVQGQVVATHTRCLQHDTMVLDPLHYLATLSRKPGALDHAPVYRDWELPAC